MVKIIDSHVHDRGGDQESYKETPAHALEVARDSGVSAIYVMPNTKPPILERSHVEARLRQADEANVKEVTYGIWMGLSANREQVKRAVQVYRDMFPRVIGFKLYAGHSVNELGVIEFDDQFGVYKTLAQDGFDGLLYVHAEKESVMRPDLWNKTDPFTHCLARPEDAELESIRDQSVLARETNFKGKLHIAHISTSLGVDHVNIERINGLDISCGVCPHHLMYDYGMMKGEKGLLYKMNPPLRAPGEPEKLLEDLRNGRIDWIETDHAPHSKEDKEELCMSGLTALADWPLFPEFLRRNGFSKRRIEDVLSGNFERRARIEVSENKSRLKDRRGDYPFNFYKTLAAQLEFPAYEGK